MRKDQLKIEKKKKLEERKERFKYKVKQFKVTLAILLLFITMLFMSMRGFFALYNHEKAEAVVIRTPSIDEDTYGIEYINKNNEKIKTKYKRHNKEKSYLPKLGERFYIYYYKNNLSDPNPSKFIYWFHNAGGKYMLKDKDIWVSWFFCTLLAYLIFAFSFRLFIIVFKTKRRKSTLPSLLTGGVWIKRDCLSCFYMRGDRSYAERKLFLEQIDTFVKANNLPNKFTLLMTQMWDFLPNDLEGYKIILVNDKAFMQCLIEARDQWPDGVDDEAADNHNSITIVASLLAHPIINDPIELLFSRPKYVVNDLFVNKKYQNRGIGSALLTFAENTFSKPITLKIKMDNLSVCSFCEKRDWHKISEHIDEDEPYVLYVKR